MNLPRTWTALAAALCLASTPCLPQVYSPYVQREGQPDTRTVKALAAGIIQQAHARTDREKAEAIWRFFLTDGRFVAPGFWYHIAGWAYEEPLGEVLDPLKLLNSYGFGLCYQIAPLLEAVWEAAGFPGARVWFLTGHTVTEVFYDGAYHYYDSDMLGYNVVGNGDFRRLPVASVHQLEQDGRIMLGKLNSPTTADPKFVDSPWYPADLRARAMDGLAELFTTASDNWLFPFTRFPQGHSMSFVLRPGERLIRYFRPEPDRSFYLPFQLIQGRWREFPHEVESFQIRTEDGPRSQKDSRTWATGRIEYTPVLSSPEAYYPAFGPGFNENLSLPKPVGHQALSQAQAGLPARAVFEVTCPYVIIDAAIAVDAILASGGNRLRLETSTDGGRTWDPAGELSGPHQGIWEAAPRIRAKGEHGAMSVVSGTYGYLVRLSLLGPGPSSAIAVNHVTLNSRFQLNPRTLPALAKGSNMLTLQTGVAERRDPIHVRIADVARYASKTQNARYHAEQDQGFLMPAADGPAELVFEVASPAGSTLSGFDAGGRFLDIRGGQAPDKYTAEVRKTALQLSPAPAASIEWSASPNGPFTPLWTYDPAPKWPDGDPIDRLLRWPEVDRAVRALPPGASKVYVRYRIQGMALDDIRLAAISPQPANSGSLEISHAWSENGKSRTHVERVSVPASEHRYSINTRGDVTNESITLYCPPRQ